MKKIIFGNAVVILSVFFLVILISHPAKAVLPTISLGTYRPDCGTIRYIDPKVDFYASYGNQPGHPCLDRFAGKNFWAYVPPQNPEADYNIPILGGALNQCSGRIFLKKYNYTSGVHISTQEISRSALNVSGNMDSIAVSQSTVGQGHNISSTSDASGCNLVELSDAQAYWWKTHTNQLCEYGAMEVVCEGNSGSNSGTSPTVGPAVTPPQNSPANPEDCSRMVSTSSNPLWNSYMNPLYPEAHFGAPRGGRRHLGNDVYGNNYGQAVYAPVSGTVIDVWPFVGNTSGTQVSYLVIIRPDNPNLPLIGIGEINPSSSVAVGSHLGVGDSVGGMGYNGYRPMVHFEAYSASFASNQGWRNISARNSASAANGYNGWLNSAGFLNNNSFGSGCH